MTDVKQQRATGLFEGSIVKKVNATAQLELIGGPHMPIQKLIITSSRTSCCRPKCCLSWLVSVQKPPDFTMPAYSDL